LSNCATVFMVATPGLLLGSSYRILDRRRQSKT